MISVVIPTFNEEKNITELLSQISRELSSKEYELIVVDDASTDHTALVVLCVLDKHVRLIKRRAKKRSLAGSILDGIRESKGDIIIVMDSDFNHSPSYLKEFLSRIGEHDLVSASRFEKADLSQMSFRLKLTFIFSRSVRFLTGIRQADCTFGFFAVKREVLEQCPLEKIFRGFGDYYFRFLYYVQKLPVRAIEFPAEHTQRLSGEGNKRIVRTAFSYAKEALKLFCARFLYA